MRNTSATLQPSARRQPISRTALRNRHIIRVGDQVEPDDDREHRSDRHAVAVAGRKASSV